MRALVVILASLALGLPTVAFADAAEDARQWYESQYAPLWVSVDDIDSERIGEAYAENFHEITYSGEVFPHENSIEFWEDRFVIWETGGWQGGRLDDVGAYLISPNTVMLEVQWEQFMSDGSSGPVVSRISQSGPVTRGNSRAR